MSIYVKTKQNSFVYVSDFNILWTGLDLLILFGIRQISFDPDPQN